jgi:uncharacterized protein YjbJ (UPF0337 family)
VIRHGAQAAAGSAFFINHVGEFAMNKEQVKGRVDEAVGKVKEVTGRAVDDKSLQAKGLAQQVGGKAVATAGDIKEDVKDVLKDKNADRY